jgi:hypothetical protein
MRVAWWDWQEAKVRAHIDQLSSPDVATFIAQHDPAGVTEDCPACQHSAAGR